MMKVLTHQASSDTTQPAGVSRNLGFPFSPGWCGWSWSHSYFLWPLGVEQLLSKFPVFLDCFFPGPLTRETRFLGGAFLYAPIIISRLLALFVSSLRYMKGEKKKKEHKNPLLHRSLSSKVPRHPPSALHL